MSLQYPVWLRTTTNGLNQKASSARSGRTHSRGSLNRMWCLTCQQRAADQAINTLNPTAELSTTPNVKPGNLDGFAMVLGLWALQEDLCWVTGGLPHFRCRNEKCRVDFLCSCTVSRNTLLALFLSCLDRLVTVLPQKCRLGHQLSASFCWARPSTPLLGDMFGNSSRWIIVSSVGGETSAKKLY